MQIHQADVEACIAFDGEIPGFAIPIFVHAATSSQRLVQEIDELSHRVIAFRSLESDDASTISIINGPTSSVGGVPIYAFVAYEGQPYVGTLSELKPMLSDFAKRFPNALAIKLQIFELIGTAEEKRSVRLEMRKLIQETTGEIAARQFYEGSTLQCSLWSHLLENAHDEAAARRILASRNRAIARVDAMGRIALDLSALDPNDYSRTSLDSLTRQLEGEFDITPANTSVIPVVDEKQSTDTDIEPQTPHADLTPDELQAAYVGLRKIQSASKQEERLAILLGTILENQTVGRHILKLYPSDKAKYAGLVLKDLSEALSIHVAGQLPLGPPYPPSISATDLARIVQRPFSRGMPANRVLLLYFMAKHLAKYPAINKFVREKLDRTRTIFMEPYRSEIDRYLSNPTDRQKATKRTGQGDLF